MATAAIDVRKKREEPASALVKPEGQLHAVVRRFRRHRMAVVSLVLITIIFAVSLLAPFIAPFGRDDIEISGNARFAPFFSVQSETGKVHILGTDHIGRDLLTRLLYGARVTLTIALVVATCSTLIGVTVGAIAGYYRGVIDTMLMRFLDFMAVIPDFPILLIVSSILVTDPRLIPLPSILVNTMESVMLLNEREARQTAMIMIVLIAFGWIGAARLMRGMVLSIRERDFIESSRALGTPNYRIILRHVIPNAIAPIIVQFTQQLANAFALETALSFLGFGVQDPVPTWGNMMKLAQEFIFEQRLLPLLVGLPILICSLAFNFIGDGLRDALDPRLKM